MSEPVIFNLRRPSDALEAMCDGLEAIEARDAFGVDMGTFGKFSGEVCYVCAATAAAIKASGLLPEGAEDLTPSQIEDSVSRARVFGQEYDHFKLFEEAMDLARYGSLDALAEFFGLAETTLHHWQYRWELRTGTWQRYLPAMRAAILEMREAGL